jgi:hypothetical protein
MFRGKWEKGGRREGRWGLGIREGRADTEVKPLHGWRWVRNVPGNWIGLWENGVDRAVHARGERRQEGEAFGLRWLIP